MEDTATKLYLGTSGFSYADWVGPVYPTGTPPANYLEQYTKLFRFVELNFSYYRLPDSGMIERLRDRTPEAFRFSIKAPGSITHDDSMNLDDEAARFLKSIQPLQAAGKLAGILVQLPYRFHYTRSNRERLGRICDALDRHPLFLEFRNRDWNRQRVISEMRERGLFWVVPDLPRLDGLPDATPVATGSLGYIRLHGRNSANWWHGDAVSRYDYLYTDQEIAEIVTTVRTLADLTETLYVAFNNHASGHAVKNAFLLLDSLGPEFLSSPGPGT